MRICIVAFLAPERHPLSLCTITHQSCANLIFIAHDCLHPSCFHLVPGSSGNAWTLHLKSYWHTHTNGKIIELRKVYIKLLENIEAGEDSKRNQNITNEWMNGGMNEWNRQKYFTQQRTKDKSFLSVLIFVLIFAVIFFMSGYWPLNSAVLYNSIHLIDWYFIYDCIALKSCRHCL